MGVDNKANMQDAVVDPKEDGGAPDARLLPRQQVAAEIDRDRILEVVYPHDMADRTVLQLGARDGYYCTEAIRRGARRALGLDTNQENVLNASLAAETSGLAAEFRQMDFKGPLPSESFDDVICLDGLRLLPEPFSILDQLIDATKDRLVIEVDEIGTKGQKSLKLNWWRRLLLKGLTDLPVVFVAPNSLRTNRHRFYLSPEAIRQFMAVQRQVFASVQVTASPRKGRRLIIGQKRHIDRLLVIAGPTSAGKTTLIDCLSRGEIPEISDQVGIQNLKDWESRHVYELAKERRTRLQRVMLHYDFLTRVKWDFEHSQMSDFVDTIRSADNVTLLTLWTEPEQLKKQFERSEIEGHLRRHGNKPMNKKTLQLQQDYCQPEKVMHYYRSWFDHTASLPVRHLVLAQSPNWRVTSVDQWRAEND